MADELKPCPFCGARGLSRNGAAVRYGMTDIEPDPDGQLILAADGFGWYNVNCWKCGMSAPKAHGVVSFEIPSNREKAKKAFAEAIRLWNTRAGDQLSLMGDDAWKGER